jgi:hypothetical protein
MAYAKKHQLLPSQILFRLDGGYGDTAVLSKVLAMGLGVIARSRDYALLGRPEVLAVLSRPPTARCVHPESGMIRDVYDCPLIRLTRGGPCVRLVIATHPATDDPPKVGQERNGVVYELFVSTILAQAVTANDLLDLYRHRGSFETVLADEDYEQDPDRWCSHTPYGQEFWQILSQWVWNLRLEFGQHCSAEPLRTTTFASANDPAKVREGAGETQASEDGQPAKVREPEGGMQAHSENTLTPVNRPAGVSEAVWDSELSYGPAQWAQPSFTGGFPGSAFLPQADGTLLCPAGKVLTLVECRQERAKSVRVSYSADLGDCRCCPLRAHCQKRRTHRARRVSAVYWPQSSPSLPVLHPPPPVASPVLWRDWPRCSLRRQWIKIVRSQSVTITKEPALPSDPSADLPSPPLTRSERAHWRLSWEQRLSRNARPASSPSVTVTLHGLPAAFAQIYGFALCDVASA